MGPEKYKRILIIQTAFLGDVILITPLIRAARELFGEARIDVLITPETRGILSNNPHITDVVTFDKRRNKLLALWETGRRLRRSRYALAITPHSSLTTAYLMRWAGIPERLGFDRWAAARHLTMKVPHLEERGLHKIRRNLHLLSVFTEREFDIQSEVFPDDAMAARAKDLLETLPHPGRPRVVICPASLWFTKRWPEEHFVELTAGLDREGLNIVFDGGPDDHELCRRIIEKSGAEALNICKATNPLESAALIERCDLLISGDSAPVHLANAVKTDVFAINGPTDTMETGYFPFRENDRIFELEMDCRPCGPHGATKCPLGHHNCMKELRPATILEEVAARLR